MPPLLEARNVTKVFGGGVFNRTTTVALDNFSMTIDDDTPTITAVVGESGSGKTTLARLLLGATAPTEGSVLYKGQDLRKLSRFESREFLQNVQVIFQDPFEVYNPFYQVDHGLRGIEKLEELDDLAVLHGRADCVGRRTIRMGAATAIRGKPHLFRRTGANDARAG